MFINKGRSMRNSILPLLGLVLSILHAQYPPAEEILKKIDANLVSKNRIATTTMIIHGRRGSRSVSAKSWIQGVEKSFTEYLAPPREKGTKMLKIGDQLWMYSPATDRIIRIAGHMLRQSLMGVGFVLRRYDGGSETDQFV